MILNLTIKNLISDEQCNEQVRQLRWRKGIACPHCRARDEDGDGFHEVHVNTMEGFWSLLRSWLRLHRGISQEKLPLYLGFFKFVHNVRKQGKSLLNSLVQLLVKLDPGIYIELRFFPHTAYCIDTIRILALRSSSIRCLIIGERPEIFQSKSGSK